MRSVQSIIFSNSLAIVLTIVCVLPITAVFVFSLTAPIDDAFANFGLWLHNKYEWSVATFVTELRFAKVGFALRSVLIALFISFLYYWITNWLNFGLANFRSSKSIGKRAAIAEAIQPWIFVGPALVLLLLFLLIPALATLKISFTEPNGAASVSNYAFLWDPSALGYLQLLLIAVLADSVRWGVVAKTFIFVPLAISFVGAAVIWRNIFAGGGIEPQEAINGATPSYQIGLLKALLGHTPEYNEPLYNLKFWGNFYLMWIMVWIKTGFAMVIFSAALRGVPQETVEAAIIDGANPRQLFFRVKLPQIFSTVVVVWTYLVTDVLKVFDIPYALSANDDDKLLLATMMEAAMNTWSIGGNNVDNLFAAIAIMLMLTVIPHMIFLGWRIRREQKQLGH